ncbi:hypothetical protein [Streptomyces silvisoli]|uniref:RNA polymerase sigma factor 70 region 4 type 2 domain-containing protein n=1 Tax=Streptomyces silvisoli TaxID=3034235 RepID=A0ABT5ZRD8_9ACTN|nr:hypothetical protein [Streptomyces silvisoli]MDF3292383.1 hypothetical protein [Streptomyces silvisoli]
MADTVVLHARIGLPMSEAAALMGLSLGNVGALFTGACRKLADGNRLVQALCHEGLPLPTTSVGSPVPTTIAQ